ncbi:TetR/AcrR family transcriptional regulator [Novosphingobium sp. PS1R-30]|uniref:TetR/AcrR family transcriptional regulator n=1 Tax=Novosphingobium anseongense TaxID=3133436 RepID=A0ABU8S2V2_9SPHN
MPQRSMVKDIRAARTGTALREALLRLLALHSFEQITARDICREAGVHYATFFRHHEGKQTLLEEIAADQIAALVELTLPVAAAADHAAGFVALCAYVQEHRDLWKVLLNGGAGLAMRAEWLRRARAVAQAMPPTESWLPRDLGIVCTTGMIADTISWWLEQPDDAHGVDEVSRILSRLSIPMLSGGPS